MRLMSKVRSGPTPRLWMLYPRRANTPVITSSTPGLLSTRMEMVCGVNLALGSILGMSSPLLAPAAPSAASPNEAFSTGMSHTPTPSSDMEVYTSPMFSMPSDPSFMLATARTMRLATALSYAPLELPGSRPATAALAFFMASMSFTLRRRLSLNTGSRFRASLPVRATCTMPNLVHTSWNARLRPGSPVMAMVSVVAATSTTEARKMRLISISSVRSAGLAFTLISISPRSTHCLSVTFSTLRTLASLLICLMSFSVSLFVAITTTVKMALSMLSPTARLSML
mmetsp:Transcript_39786/g.98478  ORF Transcript_39786/g.98478 Transcript_39786/m.98478 type:complete len:284 (+) Transcript_39786:662-1513(+)